MYYDTTIQVRFCEVDAYQVVWHGHYCAWFEIGRNGLAYRFGLDPQQLREIGFMAPVVELVCRFKLPARYGDQVVIRTTMERCETAKLIFHYQLLRDGDLLAEGSTTHVLTDLGGTMLYRVPNRVKERLERMFAYLGV